jgi:hypothetical protein
VAPPGYLEPTDKVTGRTESNERSPFPTWLKSRWYYVGTPVLLYAALALFKGWRGAFESWGAILITTVLAELFVLPWFRSQVGDDHER